MKTSSNLPLNTAGNGGYIFERDGYTRADHHRLTTDDIESATVYGRDDEKIGSVSSLSLDTEGRITEAVIDVGGFLGLGAHPVVMPFTDLTVLRQNSGSDVRVHLDTTKDRLLAMPQHTA